MFLETIVLGLALQKKGKKVVAIMIILRNIKCIGEMVCRSCRNQKELLGLWCWVSGGWMKWERLHLEMRPLDRI